MLFAAGISITLFFCVSEPLTHYLQPPQGGTGSGEASARQAMQVLFLHWGLHGWGVFALAAMALAYFALRHNLPLALRSALYPLIGKRINGPIGYTVDALGIVATVFGLGADMGFGVLHLNAGLSTLMDVPHTHWVQVALIVAMMGAAIVWRSPALKRRALDVGHQHAAGDCAVVVDAVCRPNAVPAQCADAEPG